MGVGCVKMELMESSSPDLIKDQPDADNIKMFVGQIPKTWDENRLRQMFEQFGPVHTLNVLRDKVTSISRGESLKMEALAPGHTNGRIIWGGINEILQCPSILGPRAVPINIK